MPEDIRENDFNLNIPRYVEHARKNTRKNLKLKYRDKINKPEVTDETAKKVQEDYAALLKQIDTEFSEFYSVFTSVQWKPGIAKFEEINNSFVANIIFYKEFNIIKSGLTIRPSLTIQQFMYKIEVFLITGGYNKSIYKKELSYTESITERDKTDIINIIGRYINMFIETHGFTNKIL